MILTFRVAQQSPDPSTQNGVVLLDPDGEVLGADCNTFPAGVQATDERLQRPLKYSFIEHAERNAVFAAARAGIPLQGTTMTCTWPPCAECARAIAQSGIAELVIPAATPDDESAPGGHWQEALSAAEEILEEAGVTVTELDVSGLELPAIRRNGKLSGGRTPQPDTQTKSHRDAQAKPAAFSPLYGRHPLRADAGDQPAEAQPSLLDRAKHYPSLREFYEDHSTRNPGGTWTRFGIAKLPGSEVEWTLEHQAETDEVVAIAPRDSGSEHRVIVLGKIRNGREELARLLGGRRDRDDEQFQLDEVIRLMHDAGHRLGVPDRVTA